MPSFISRVLHFALRLVLWIFAAVFAISLFVAGFIFIALSLLKSLFTGQKPNPAMLFSRFQRFPAPTMWQGTGMRGATAARAAEVVDVEVREIRKDKRLP